MKTHVIAATAALLAGLSTHAQAETMSNTTTSSAGDALMYLEQAKEPTALSWAKTQTHLTTKTIQGFPEYKSVSAGLKEALSRFSPAPEYTIVGDRYLRFRRSAQNPYGMLEVALRQPDGSVGEWKTALDMGNLRKSEGKPYELILFNLQHACMPETGRCLLTLSPGGGDGVEIREFDLNTSTFVEGGFRTPVARATAVWLDKDTVLAGVATGDETVTSARWPARYRRWQRGMDFFHAPVVFDGPHTDAITTLSSMPGQDGRYRGIIVRAIDYSTFDLTLVDTDGTTHHVDLPQKLKPIEDIATTGHHLILQLAEPAVIDGKDYPAESVITYDIAAATNRVQSVFTPSNGDYVNDAFTGLAGTKSKVWFVVENHLRRRLVVASETPGGWTSHDVLQADVGKSLAVVATDFSNQQVMTGEEGFISPLQLSMASEAGWRSDIYAQPAAFDASGMQVDIKSASSTDGTQLDYYLIHPKLLSQSSANPTLVTAYGGFGVSLTPTYMGWNDGGPATQLWYAHGGSLAIPIIRGGGERGEAWHRAAMGVDRQKAFDDFLAVVRQLEHGYTTTHKLGAFGSSNGGLLTATVGTEAPDLFGAIVSDVPLTDMARFPLMGMGAAWTKEYGDPGDPAQLPALLRYSPYQNVKTGVTYPPFFLTVSTEDVRVGPGHARKMAARLQSVGGKAFYYEDPEGGHGVSDALQRPELMALRMTFLIHTLMPYTGPGSKP